jgi:precorrin-6B methylase 2
VRCAVVSQKLAELKRRYIGLGPTPETANPAILAWLLGGSQPKLCLDVAAATGTYAIGVAESGAQCHAIELTGTLREFIRIRAVAAHVLPQIQMSTGYAPDIVDQNDVCDMLVDSGLMTSHAVEDRGSYIRWMARVLRPGGRCAIRISDGDTLDPIIDISKRRAIIELITHDFTLERELLETPAGSTQKPACWLCVSRSDGSK